MNGLVYIFEDLSTLTRLVRKLCETGRSDNHPLVRFRVKKVCRFLVADYPEVYPLLRAIFAK